MLALAAATAWGATALLVRVAPRPHGYMGLYSELEEACPDRLAVPLPAASLPPPIHGAAPAPPVLLTAPRYDDDDLIDINRAGVRELCRLPGIGPETAARIVAYRRFRPFAVPEDIREVRGIGPSTYEAIAPLIKVR